MAKGFTVELVYDADCPNVGSARLALGGALTKLGLKVSWTEWEKSDPLIPRELLLWGSPTVLVNGNDVFKSGEKGSGACCRLYPDGEKKFAGFPSVKMVADAVLAVITGATATGEIN